MYPHISLSTPATPIFSITKAIHQDIQSCIELLQSTDNAAALAANQIGSAYAFFSFYMSNGTVKTVINPQILSISDKYLVQEGCLSFKGTILIPRYRQISVSYLDFRRMELVYEDLTDFTAEIFQHECEHLAGNNFSDNLTNEKARIKFLSHQR